MHAGDRARGQPVRHRRRLRPDDERGAGRQGAAGPARRRLRRDQGRQLRRGGRIRRSPTTSPEHVYLCCDASLHRLQSDHIDLYQCHIGDLADPIVFLEAFERLVERGKIRAYGISTNSLAVAQAFNRDGKCAAVQLNYSIANPSAASDLLPWCQQNDIGTLIRGPLAQGVLAGKFTAESRFDDSVRRGWNEGSAHAQFLKRLDQVDRLRFLERPGRTLAQAALQWVLANPGVTCAIPGAKNLAQIRANAGAADAALSGEAARAGRAGDRGRLRTVAGTFQLVDLTHP